MAVVEYMLQRDNGGTKKSVPGFIRDRGLSYSSVNRTYVGWIEDDRDFYVPDTIKILTKEDYVKRQLAIHAETPFQNTEWDNGEEVVRDQTVEEVTNGAESFYDHFVALMEAKDNANSN